MKTKSRNLLFFKTTCLKNVVTYNQLPTFLFKFSRLRSRTTLATDSILKASVYCTLEC